jgi:hypothetical protein
MGRLTGVLVNRKRRLRIDLIIHSPAGIPMLMARIVSVWAMGRKKTRTHRQNRMR